MSALKAQGPSTSTHVPCACPCACLGRLLYDCHHHHECACRNRASTPCTLAAGTEKSRLAMCQPDCSTTFSDTLVRLILLIFLLCCRRGEAHQYDHHHSPIPAGTKMEWPDVEHAPPSPHVLEVSVRPYLVSGRCQQHGHLDRRPRKGPISWQCSARPLHEPLGGRGSSYSGRVMSCRIISSHLISWHLISHARGASLHPGWND